MSRHGPPTAQAPTPGRQSQELARRALQRCTRMGAGRRGSSWRNFSCSSRPLARIACRSWDGSASPGGGERLRDLRHGEELQGSLVDLPGAAAQRQAQHHVAQVDRLAPRRGAHLGEGHVDQQQASATDQQVGRLYVAVSPAPCPTSCGRSAAAAKHGHGSAGRRDRDRQPDQPAALDVARQRRCRTRRAAADGQFRYPGLSVTGRRRRAGVHTYPRRCRNRQDSQPGSTGSQ